MTQIVKTEEISPLELLQREAAAQTARLRLLAAPFDPKEIDWRIGQAGSKEGKPWAKVLAYIDARAVMDRLDDIVGPGNWKDRYWAEGSGESRGNMCGLSIRVNGEWVEKVDGSEETDIEAFKGGISKALVRAGVKWGIGRYLYNLGDGWANIVATGTKGSRWQPAKSGGSSPNQNYPAFNWLPPELPPWALPSQAVAGAAGKLNGSGADATAVAVRTSAKTDALKGRLAGEQKGIPSQGPGSPAAGAPGGPSSGPGAFSWSEEAVDAFFEKESQLPGDARYGNPISPGAGRPGFPGERPANSGIGIPGVRPDSGAGPKAGAAANQVQPLGAGGGIQQGPGGERPAQSGVVQGAPTNESGQEAGRGRKTPNAGASAQQAAPTGASGSATERGADGHAQQPAGKRMAQAQQDLGHSEELRPGEPGRISEGAGAPGQGEHVLARAPMTDLELAAAVKNLKQATTIAFLQFTWKGLNARYKTLPASQQAELELAKNQRKRELGE